MLDRGGGPQAFQGRCVDFIVRPRTPADVPLVGELIMRQQPQTRYSFRNPLPFPIEEFVVRDGELAAWVATPLRRHRLVDRLPIHNH